MHVFHIRGFSGIFMVLLAILAAIVILLLLPASFMMVLWNALVFEGLRGPEIDIYQGFLLWGSVMVLIKLIFKPEIKLELQQLPMNGKPASKAPQAVQKSEQAEEQSPAAMEDAPPAKPVDNQN
ncbi:MAG TPA: hypothetical protein V6C52_10790 [Coleofasciculaceae cyanobacterium]|jgi:hypothetical protein